MNTKFHFPVLAFALFAFNAGAQVITLTSANMPTQNTVVVTDYLDNAYSDTMSIGPSGANQHWDFSQAVTTNFPDHQYYEAPDQTPHPAGFPGSNLASTYELSDTAEYNYYNLNANGFSQLGILGSGEQLTFSPALKIFDFPCTYQNSLNQVVAASGSLDGQQVVGQYKLQMNVDGYGTVKTSLGTFNCLRVKRISELNLSVFIFNIIQRDTTYEFWTNQYKAPVFTYDRYSTNYLGQVETGIEATVLTGQTTPTVEPAPSPASFIQISPNPVTDNTSLTLELKTTGKVEIVVADMNGKLVSTQNLGTLNPGRYQEQLETASWPAGVYMAMIRQNGKIAGIRKLVKE